MRKQLKEFGRALVLAIPTATVYCIWPKYQVAEIVIGILVGTPLLVWWDYKKPL